jgi:hypothetical protein
MMPSSKAKQSWNKAHYTQVKVSVPPDIAAAFKATCAMYGNSQAGVLSKFMAEYSQACFKKAESSDKLDTRKRRRAAIKDIAARLEEVLAAEERYRDNVPENLEGSKWHQASEDSISAIEDIIDDMSDIYA